MLLCHTKGAVDMIQTRLSQDEEVLVRTYARAQGISVSDLIRNSIFEKIEDEIDLKAYEAAMAAHDNEPQAVGFDEMYAMING